MKIQTDKAFKAVICAGLALVAAGGARAAWQGAKNSVYERAMTEIADRAYQNPLCTAAQLDGQTAPYSFRVLGHEFESGIVKVDRSAIHVLPNRLGNIKQGFFLVGHTNNGRDVQVFPFYPTAPCPDRNVSEPGLK